ncbi:hypothetical protein CYMTET_34032, partial [Cymbomonas tetramitiformis]
AASGAADVGAKIESGASWNPYTGPFDVAIPALLLCTVAARMLWSEHRGGVYKADSGGMAVGSIRQAGAAIWSNSGLQSTMCMIALYEAALYIFVFLWTPVLEQRAAEGKDIPHGIIFSLFMCCKMVGSQLFVLGLGEGRYYSEKCLCFVFAASVICFLVPMFTDSYIGALLAFCMYECGLGLYWPAIAMLRADLVPDDIRSTVASLFRVPLNVLVVGCLLCIGRTSERVILLVCCAKVCSSWGEPAPECARCAPLGVSLRQSAP